MHFCSTRDASGQWREVSFSSTRRGPVIEVFRDEQDGRRCRVFFSRENLNQAFTRGQAKAGPIELLYHTVEGTRRQGQVRMRILPRFRSGQVVTAGTDLVFSEAEIEQLMDEAERVQAEAAAEARAKAEEAKRRQEKIRREKAAKHRQASEERAKALLAESERLIQEAEALVKADAKAKPKPKKVKAKARPKPAPADKPQHLWTSEDYARDQGRGNRA